MDLTDIADYELRMFMEDMMKMSKCIVCNERLKPPVVTCIEGHLSCYMCHKLKCDICSSDIMKNVQLSTVQKWLLHMPKKCQYFNRGCRAIILPSSPHEWYCPFSHVCGDCGYVGNIVRHVERNPCQKEDVIVMYSNEITSYWNALITQQRKYLLFHGTLFRILAQVRKGFATTEVYCMRTKRTDKDFIYTIMYRHGEIEFVYTANVVDYKRRDRFAENNENFTIFPESKLPYLYDNGRLNFTFRVMKLKREKPAEGPQDVIHGTTISVPSNHLA